MFLGKSPLEPTPEVPALDNRSTVTTTDDNNNNSNNNANSKSVSPANGFPLRPSEFSDDSSGDGADDEDASSGSGAAAAGVAAAAAPAAGLGLSGGGGGGRAAMWGGVFGGGSRSVRDFTASRAASSRRMAERKRNGSGSADSGSGSGSGSGGGGESELGESGLVRQEEEDIIASRPKA